MKSPTSAHGVPVASDVPGTQNQPTHLKIANGSVVVVQEQSSGNISRKHFFCFCFVSHGKKEFMFSWKQTSLAMRDYLLHLYNVFAVGVATITSQQAQNQTNSPVQQGIVTNNLPLLVRIIFSFFFNFSICDCHGQACC